MPRFRMSYHCEPCDEVWQMEWPHACNDRCPHCRAEEEPVDVEDIEGEAA